MPGPPTARGGAVPEPVRVDFSPSLNTGRENRTGRERTAGRGFSAADSRSARRPNPSFQYVPRRLGALAQGILPASSGPRRVRNASPTASRTPTSEAVLAPSLPPPALQGQSSYAMISRSRITPPALPPSPGSPGGSSAPPPVVPGPAGLQRTLEPHLVQHDAFCAATGSSARVQNRTLHPGVFPAQLLAKLLLFTAAGPWEWSRSARQPL